MSDSTAAKPFDTFQQIWGMSACANVLFACTGSRERLQRGAEEVIPHYIKEDFPNWAVAWGPKVWKFQDKKSKGADSIWFAATAKGVKYADGDFDTCVVSVSGTCKLLNSDYGWPVLDKGVDTVVDFNAWVASWPEDMKNIPEPKSTPPRNDGSPFISFGTAYGVYAILSNAAPQGGMLQDYLASLKAGTRVLFTGHSMGSALAPTLALALKERGVVTLSAEGSTAHPMVMTLVSAGATPGNEAFMKDFSSAFPMPFERNPVPWKNFNSVFYNTLDVVPQAWSLDPSHERNMDNMTGKIYSEMPGHKVIEEYFVEPLKKLARKSGVDYFALPGSPFTGPPIGKNPLTLTWQLHKQHSKAYDDQTGVSLSVRRAYEYLLSILGETGLHKKTTSDAFDDFGLPADKLGLDKDIPGKSPYDEVYGED